MKIGIDIGGSHIGIGLVESNGNIIQKEEMFINDKTNIEEKIERVGPTLNDVFLKLTGKELRD